MMSPLARTMVFSLLLVLLAGHLSRERVIGQDTAAIPSLIITNVTIIDVVTGAVQADRMVAIRDGRIASVSGRGCATQR